MTDANPRLRVPPRVRFGERERFFDLDQAFESLPAQSVARDGHIQKALYRSGDTTTAIFLFEKGAGLARYRLEGEAILQVLAGRLRVTTDESRYELGPNQILLLDPDVPQGMEALERTRLLITYAGVHDADRLST